MFGPLAALRQSADLLSELTGQSYESVVLQSLACREKSVRETASALFPQKKMMPENTEASLLGAAIIGMTAMKIYTNMDQAISKMVHCNDIPDVSSEANNAAQTLFRRYLAEAENV